MVEIIKASLIMGQSVAFLWAFYHIATKGRVSFEEQNALILVSEIVLLLAILVFSVYCYVRAIRRIRKRRTDGVG